MSQRIDVGAGKGSARCRSVNVDVVQQIVAYEQDDAFDRLPDIDDHALDS